MSSSTADNNVFPQFCEKAATDINCFKTFKQSPDFTPILEHVDYGQGFGPKAKDGTPFDQAGLRESDMKITVERLKEIISEELTKAEKEKKAELEKELDDLKHK